ncbi:MAG TPA: peroxiredoxin-like family protein [Xanthobacteraceae bacterium]|nr:peroxiredoxin-like family protein [Xanthobacteraceae bacterium]
MPTASVRDDLRQAFEDARTLDGSMSERLDTFASAVARNHPNSKAIVDRLVARLRAHSAGESAPNVGDEMPPFMLPDDSGRTVALSDLLAHGPAVVTFHRGHWCPYCRISINTVARAQSRIAALGARMVAIVPDRQQFAEEMKVDSGVSFPILTDMDNGYAMSLNLAIWVGDEMEEYMRSIGRMLPQYQGNESWTLPIPATFVVGRDRRITARFVDPDYRKRMAVEDLIEALKRSG